MRKSKRESELISKSDERTAEIKTDELKNTEVKNNTTAEILEEATVDQAVESFDESSFSDTASTTADNTQNDIFDLQTEMELTAENVTANKKKKKVSSKNFETTADLSNSIIDDDLTLALNTSEMELTRKIENIFVNTVKADKKVPMIIVNDVTLRYESNEIIFEKVNMEIFPGEFIFIVGPSGAGKSSLMRMFYRDVFPSPGRIIIDHENIVKIKNSKVPFLRRKIGVIFQNYQLLPKKTVFENIAFALEATGYKKSQITKRVLEVLDLVGLLKKRTKFPTELSGGEQQRVSIARAIINNPKIIIADEPTGNLDPENSAIIMKLLNAINKKGTTVIMATHDVEIVNNAKNRVFNVSDKRITENLSGGYENA